MSAARGTVYAAGNVNVDLILGPLAQWPRIGTETVLPHSELRVGGQAGNAGLALAALGARHRVVANTGNDVLGQWLADAFPGSGRHWPRAAAATTITVGISHATGERTFLTTLGHLAALAPEQILAQLPERAAPGDVVLLCGVFLSPLVLAGGLGLLRALRERGYAVALDTGWPDAGWDAVRASVESWLGLVDHLLLNEVETAALARSDDPERAARWFQSRLAPGATLAVKCGSQGVRAWRDGMRLSHPAPAVAVVDTVGAGDVFNAGYLSGLQAGCQLAAALRLGVDTAAQAISTAPRRYAAPAGRTGGQPAADAS